jgi:hypothetical protein
MTSRAMKGLAFILVGVVLLAAAVFVVKDGREHTPARNVVNQKVTAAPPRVMEVVTTLPPVVVNSPLHPKTPHPAKNGLPQETQTMGLLLPSGMMPATLTDPNLGARIVQVRTLKQPAGLKPLGIGDYRARDSAGGGLDVTLRGGVSTISTSLYDKLWPAMPPADSPEWETATFCIAIMPQDIDQARKIARESTRPAASSPNTASNSPAAK